LLSRHPTSQLFINENSVAATFQLVAALTHLFDRRKAEQALEATRLAADKVRSRSLPLVRRLVARGLTARPVASVWHLYQASVRFRELMPKAEKERVAHAPRFGTKQVRQRERASLG